MVIDEPVRGVFAYLEHPGIMAMSGLEQMRWFQRKDIPYGPVWYVSGAEVVESGPGMSTWRVPITPWLRSAAGTLTGGVLALAADGPLGSALYSTFPPGTWLSTSELSFHFVRPAPDSGAIITRARLIQAGRSQGLSEATIEDAEGHMLAHATARNIISSLPDLPAADPPDGPIPWPEYEGPHPFQRPAEGDVVRQEVWDRMSGLEMNEAWKRGELPAAPMANLIGAKHFDFSEGKWSMTVPASPWWTTAAGTFFGGALAMFVDFAMNGAVHTVLPAATTWATLDLKVNLLRPVAPDGADLRVSGTVLRKGRTIAVIAGEIATADGKTVALANASAMLLPGRPWTKAATMDQAPGADG
jgi:uncharacterized protein (TIGR00369 family)